MLPPDHPLRLNLADEVHARPPEPVDTPSRATYVALLVAADDRPRELAHIGALCAGYGVAVPQAGANQFSAQLGPVRFKWERHGEFSSFTLFTPGLSARPYSEPVAALLPAGWLAGLPGSTLVAAHAKLIRAHDALSADALAAHFGANIVVGSEIGGGAGHAYTDFRIHGDGFARFLVCDRRFTPRQAGRMLQRLFEIEAYRMLTLLALPVARRQAPSTAQTERALSLLAGDIAADGGDDEALLQQLTRLAAGIEGEITASQFRYGACRAYHALVLTRIAELREAGLPGTQTIEEFMARRLVPAVETCATAARRLQELSERVTQISALLSTRVDIKRERQNQALLASMDRRARLQLRLQQTVEGLSLAAIVYYVVGLVAYAVKGGKSAGLPLDTDMAVGIAVPVVALLMLLLLRRARRRLHRDADEQHPAPM